MPPIQNTITENAPLSKKKDRKACLPSILLSRDFFTKPRNRKWISEHGSDAVIILQTVWLASSQETGCKIHKDEALYISYPLPFEPSKIETVLNSAVSVGLLDMDGDYYFNSQIIEDQRNFKAKQDNYSKGRQKRDGLIPESSQNPPRILPESCENHIEYRTLNTEDLKIEDPKEGGSKGETIDLGHGITLDPMAMDSLKMEFARFDLKPGWIKRAAVYCATQDNQKYKNGPYLYLSTWGLQRCLEEKDKALRIKNTENIGKKYDPGPKRPATMSPARPETTGPPSVNPQVTRLVEGLTKTMT